MSSTNPQRDKALTRFYEDEILPLSRAHGMEILDHTPPESAPSYFLTRTRPRMSRADFAPRLGDEGQAARTLDSQWSGTPMRGLGKKLLRLTRHFPHAEEKSELSASVYEMF